jgi:hypothetical protein
MVRIGQIAVLSMARFVLDPRLLAQGGGGAPQIPPQYDVLPPNLLSVSYSTAEVDVRTQAQSVPMMGSTLDPLSGTPYQLPSSGVASGVDYLAYQFDLAFIPEVVQAISVTEASFLSAGGSTLFIAGIIDNVGGNVSGTADSLESAISGASLTRFH